MGRRKRLNIPSAIASQHNSTSSLNYKHNPKRSTDLSGELSASEYRSDDNDATPIPSLHGNLVRRRYRRDPLEFYEPLESIGEGSMGSVSKVRKRKHAIGGSARPEFVQAQSWNKVFGWIPVPFAFCPLRTCTSDVSHNNEENSKLVYGESGRSIPGRNSPHTVPKEETASQNCFVMFCCPAFEKSNPLMSPISEIENRGSRITEKKHDRILLQGCFSGSFCPLLAKTETSVSKISSRTGESTLLRTTDSLQSASSNEMEDKYGDLDKKNSEEVERQLDKTLKRSTSSMITYGHKEVIYALKSIHLDRVSSADFMNELKNEVSILKELDHANIVKCFETFMYKGSLYLVLELCSGSDLYSRDPYSEEEARKIIRALLSAVAYMHSKRIIHRDLKYENIMFASSDPDAEVKIIDFGLSAKFAASTYLHETVGTVYTMAPELLRGKGYGKAIDVWSLGICSFMLLSSSMPFYGKDRKQVIKKIIRGQYEFNSRRWKTVSADAKNFVIHMLQYDSNKRPTAAKALNDPWLNASDFGSQELLSDNALLDRVQASIQTFAGYGKLKKLALMLIAYKSTSKELGFLRKMFGRFDVRQDGEVTLQEFKTALADYDYSEEELEYMFRAMDLDRTGFVHYSEFLAATFETHGAISEEQLAECFDRLDNDDSGFITKEDIVDFLGENIPQSYIDDIMTEADENNDKKISYDEFLALWGEETDRQMAEDREDVKDRRHRRNDSGATGSSFLSDFSDDDGVFDQLAINPASFERDEIAKMLDAPDTPGCRERRVSGTNAFKLEKERSMRAVSARDESRQGSSTQISHYDVPGELSKRNEG